MSHRWTRCSIKELYLSDLPGSICRFISVTGATQVMIVTDETTHEVCLKRVGELPESLSIRHFVAPRGEKCKTLEVAMALWGALMEYNFSRNDLLICIGGGALSDLSAWCAATFKRGMRLILLPTTLLSAVDASYGGKCGVDFGQVKNSIGTFYPADEIWLVSEMWDTLSTQELLSGYGELLKHAVLSGKEGLLDFISKPLVRPGVSHLSSLVRKSLDFKRSIVLQDPYDLQGLRTQLNLGHTFGHAFESLYFTQGNVLPHGIGVVAGMVCELYLSHQLTAYPKDLLTSLTYYTKEEFPPVVFDCNDYALLYDFARQDKKNIGEGIHISGLDSNSLPTPITLHSPELMNQALDFYRSFMGI